MKLNKVASSHTPGVIALGACFSNDAWVFRGTHYLFGWRENDGQLDWRTDLPDDRPTGNKQLTCMRKLAVSYSDLGQKKGAVFLGVDRANGQVVWQKKVPVWPEANGLAAGEEHVVIQSLTLKGEPRLLIMNAMSGEVLTERPSERGATVVTSGNHILVGGYRGLFLIDGKNEKGVRLLAGRIHSLVSDHPKLYVLHETEQINGEKSIICLEGQDWKEKCRVLVSSFSPLLVPLVQNPMHVITAGDQQEGIVLLDCSEGTVVWETGTDEKWETAKCVETPYGIVALFKRPKEEYQVCLLDMRNGNIIKPLDVQYSPHNIFWYEDRLIITGMVEGLQSFTLTKD